MWLLVAGVEVSAGGGVFEALLEYFQVFHYFAVSSGVALGPPPVSDWMAVVSAFCFVLARPLGALDAVVPVMMRRLVRRAF